MKYDAIIFDFNRTLFDPETRQLVLGSAETIAALHAAGLRLFLVSHNEGERETLLQSLGIWQYFSKVLFISEKRQEDFLNLLQEYHLCADRVVVIGDRIKKEIVIGNACRMKTIWMCQGKFAQERPSSLAEQPWRTVYSFSELLDLLSV